MAITKLHIFTQCQKQPFSVTSLTYSLFQFLILFHSYLRQDLIVKLTANIVQSGINKNKIHQRYCTTLTIRWVRHAIRKLKTGIKMILTINIKSRNDLLWIIPFLEPCQILLYLRYFIFQECHEIQPNPSL